MQTLKNRQLIKSIEACIEHMRFNTCYNEALKDEFRKCSRAFIHEVMKKIKARMPVFSFSVNYNPGGIAVSGDSSCFIMTTKNHGVNVFFNADSICPYVTYRVVTSSEDYTGGRNYHMELLSIDLDVLSNELITLLTKEV